MLARFEPVVGLNDEPVAAAAGEGGAGKLDLGAQRLRVGDAERGGRDERQPRGGPGDGSSFRSGLVRVGHRHWDNPWGLGFLPAS